MARFRQYKNGIFGHRYKNLYIVRNNAEQRKKGKLYWVIDKDNNILFDKTPDYDDCEWFIDCYTATDDEIELYKALYDTQINQLYRMASKYSA